jgi:hypothetical protein
VVVYDLEHVAMLLSAVGVISSVPAEVPSDVAICWLAVHRDTPPIAPL